MVKAQYRHYGCRIIDESTYKGMRVVFLENELIRVGILLDKGSDIFQFLYKPTDTDFLWRSPQGLIDPNNFIPTNANPSGMFLDNYHGGWQEVLPGGGPATYQGASLGLHGEVTQLAWDIDILTDREECIEVLLSTDCIRLPLRAQKRLKLLKNTGKLFINECVINKSQQEIDFMWGHHPAFGAPFLNKDVRIFLPAKKAKVHEPMFAPSGVLEPGMVFDWPIYPNNDLDLSDIPSPTAGFSEMIYLYELEEAWYGLIDQKKEVGFGLAWEKEIFSYIWFWSVYGEFPGYPWWNQVYVIALEPWTSMPNDLSKVIELGRQKKLKGGERLETKLCATIIAGQKEISSINLDGSIN